MVLSSKRCKAPHRQLSYNKHDIKLALKTLNREVMSGGGKDMNKVRKKEEPGVWGNMQPRRQYVRRSSDQKLLSCPSVSHAFSDPDSAFSPKQQSPDSSISVQGCGICIQVSEEVVESENYHSGLSRGYLKTKRATQTIVF